MFKEAPAPTVEQLAKIVKLEESAARQLRQQEESFDRCDTDGFLSQWASQIGAEKDRKDIAILKNGGCATFPVLCDADGEVVATKIYVFENTFAGYGYTESWRVDPVKYGRKWVPVAGYSGKSRVQKQLNLHQEYRWFPAYAKITTAHGAKNTGLGGCANAFVGTFKKDED